MSWDNGDFSLYNHAGVARYSIDDNGTVNISHQKDGNISLTSRGVFKLVRDWLRETNHTQITNEQRTELMDLLTKVSK